MSRYSKWSDREFVEFCYRQILGREPDVEGRTAHSTQLERKECTREQMFYRFLTSKEFEARSGSQEFVPTGHFYSAVPSADDRERWLKSNQNQIESLPDIDLRVEQQLVLLGEFRRYYLECPFPENKAQGLRYYFNNPAYSYTDALSLYSMIRHVKPARIIEIGSGFSSCAMLDTNDQFFDGKIELTFVEPHPELLKSLLRKTDKNCRIVADKVQDIDNSFFNVLQANDILFVDSTHVSKLGSDVNKILFEILPILERGVYIHFHDIFWPFDYPQDWVREGRAWNEAYILRAFLQGNTDYEIVFFASYLHSYQQAWFAEHMPRYLKNAGGNIWLRKKLTSDSDT